MLANSADSGFLSRLQNVSGRSKHIRSLVGISPLVGSCQFVHLSYALAGIANLTNLVELSHVLLENGVGQLELRTDNGGKVIVDEILSPVCCADYRIADVPMVKRVVDFPRGVLWFV